MKHLIIGCFFALTPFLAQAQNIEIHTGQGQFQTQDSKSYNFGRVWINTRSVVRFNVTNTGDQPLTFKRASISGSAFGASHNCAQGLAPKQKCSFSVEFWPAFEGIYSGQFVLNFVEDQIVVNLWGEGTRM